MARLNRSFASARAGKKRARGAIFVMLALGATMFAAAAGQASSPITPVAARTRDSGNGQLDRLQVTFSGLMNTSSTPVVAAAEGDPGIWVGGGYEIASFDWEPGTATTLNINLVEKSVPDTGVKPAVAYTSGSGGLKAADGEELASFSMLSAQVIDGAGPALVQVTAKDMGVANMFNAAADADATKNEQLTLRFSEPISLAGATPKDKWFSLERVMTFTKFAQTQNCADGSGTGTSFNFPQPQNNATAAQDPISVVGASIVVTAKNGNTIPSSVAGSNIFRAVPVADYWCKVGVDPTHNALVTDGSGNVAHSFNSEATPPVNVFSQLIHPVDIALLKANTIDSAPADGKIDALEFVFDQNLNDATIQTQLPNISITHDGVGAIVDTTTVDTGVAADDSRFVVHFTLPDGTTWDGGVRPQVTYAKPTGCTGTSGATTGIKGKVPSWTAQTPWQACAGSFDTPATDAVTALIKGIKTLDGDADGLLDRVEITFSERIATGGASGWKIDDRAATGFEIDATDAKVVRVEYPEGTTGDTGTLPVVRYTTQGAGSGAVKDYGALEIPAQTRNANVDGAAPRIRRATVLGNSAGKIDRAELAYSENIVDPAASAASLFSIDGQQASGLVTGNANDAILTITVAPITGSEAKPVAFAAGGAPLADAANNQSGPQSLAAADVVDGARPVGTVSIVEGAPMSAGVKTVQVSYTEAMTSTAAPTVVLHAATDRTVAPVADDANHTNGWRIDEPSKWDGTVTILPEPNGDCPVPTGCPVTVTADDATDKANPANPQLATATMSTEIDTVAPAKPLLGAFAATVAAGESAPANAINMFTSGFSLGGTFVAGDAAGGTLEMLVDGSSVTPAARTEVGSSATSATASTAFADNAALQAAVSEGAHTLSLKLCDDAQNCVRTDEEPAPATHAVTADYTPVDVSLTAPEGDNVVAGAATIAITWNGDEAGAGFDRAQLEYSADNGSTYSVIDAAQPVDGSFDWTVPTVDVSQAKVRATTVDVNGNKAYGTSKAFSIDSTAPVVLITKPTTSFPFVPAGGTAEIGWSVTDASIARVENPITIEYSTNNGSSWSQINGGDYSKSNDGEEAWNVPAGASFTTLVRVTAVDATNKSTTVSSTKLARGVDGYVADRYGSVYAFGTANGTTNELAVPRGYSVRGIALRSNGTAGYRVLHQGAIYPFSVGDTPRPAKPRYTKFGGDRARDIVLRTATSGYVLDMYGRLFPFGGAPKATVSKRFTSDYARSVVMLPNLRGGYVMDKYGRLYRFRVGNYSWPATIRTSTLSSARAVDFVLRSNSRSGWVLDSYGRLYRFGGAPSRTSTGVSRYAYAKALLLVASDSGYWVDGRGRLKPFGSAFGNPTRTTLGSGRARGAVM